jgi:hypothetical protein
MLGLLIGVGLNWGILACSVSLFHSFMTLWMQKSKQELYMAELMLPLSILSVLSKVLCEPMERAMALFLCILPVRLYLCFIEIRRQRCGKKSPKEMYLSHSASMEASVILGAICRIGIHRLFRAYSASHVYPLQFTPYRTKLLSKDPLISLFAYTDTLCTAHIRLFVGRAVCEDGMGIDKGVAIAMPIASCAFLMVQYSEWWEIGGGRYVGALPYYLLLIAVIVLEFDDMVYPFFKVISNLGRRDSNLSTSLTDFLAKSQLPPALPTNPLYDEDILSY